MITLSEQLAHCDGKDCRCMAHSNSECACDADWTPAEVYRLRAERDALQARIDGSPVAFWSDEEGPLSAEAVTDIGPCRNDVRVALVVLEDGE